jgi:hypothetical protein
MTLLASTKVRQCTDTSRTMLMGYQYGLHHQSRRLAQIQRQLDERREAASILECAQGRAQLNKPHPYQRR